MRKLLFNKSMVDALPGKDQTRRLKGLEMINTEPDLHRFCGLTTHEEYDLEPGLKPGTYALFWPKNPETVPYTPVKFPYGGIGTRFYVGETWAQGAQNEIVYKADTWPTLYTWKSPLHLSEANARFFCEIVDIRCERVANISEADAIREGVRTSPDGHFLNYGNRRLEYTTAVDSFRSLWHTLNGSESWEKNWWVWVIKFKLVNQ